MPISENYVCLNGTVVRASDAADGMNVGAISIPLDGHPIAPLVFHEIARDNLYVLMLQSCPDNGTARQLFHGTVAFKSSYGYVSPVEAPAAPSMCTPITRRRQLPVRMVVPAADLLWRHVYIEFGPRAALAPGHGILLARPAEAAVHDIRRDTLPDDHVRCRRVTMRSMRENSSLGRAPPARRRCGRSALYYGYYAEANGSGVDQDALQLAADSMSALTGTLAYVVLLVVCMGYGITKPTLGEKLRQIVLICLLFFVFDAVYMVASVDEETAVGPNAFQTFAAIPLSALSVAIMYWAFISLRDTTHILTLRHQAYGMPAAQRNAAVPDRVLARTAGR